MTTAEILDTITLILNSMLSWFTTIVNFLLTNPILAIPIYMAIVMVLIAFAFSFITKLGHKHNTD